MLGGSVKLLCWVLLREECIVVEPDNYFDDFSMLDAVTTCFYPFFCFFLSALVCSSTGSASCFDTYFPVDFFSCFAIRKVGIDLERCSFNCVVS